MENLIALVQGGATKRQGTRYINTAGDVTQPVRLIPFEFSETDTYILEFGHEYIQFYTNGGVVTTSGTTPYQISSPYSGSELSDIKYTQSADTYYITHPSHPVMKLIRNQPTDWDLIEIDFKNGPFLDQNKDFDITIASSSVSGTVTLTASGTSDLFELGHVGSLWGIQSTDKVANDISSENTFTSPALVLDIGEQLTFQTNNSTASGTTTWSGTVSVQRSIDNGISWEDIGNASINTIISISENYNDNSLFRAGFKVGDYDGGTATVSLTNSRSFGSVRVTDYISSTVVSGTVEKQLPSTDPTFRWSEGAWSSVRGYPRATTFFEQRLLFCATTNEPQDLWASKINSYEDFGVGSALDNDAYNYTLVADSQNELLWMLENRVLNIGTFGGEWTFGYKDEPTTPSTVNAKRQTTEGSASIAGVAINNDVLFMQKGNKKLRKKTYDFTVDGYYSDDIGKKAQNLFNDSIVDMVFQNATTPVLWMITAVGDLIGCTYQPRQEVIAFHKHTTQGEFESVATITGADREELWVVVKRNINGIDTRYIELFQTDEWTDVKDAYFSDASIPFNGSQQTTFSGASHLENETCRVLVDGATQQDVTISGGSFTIDGPADKVILGLGYDAVLQTMPVVPVIEQGSSFAKAKKLAKLSILLHKTINASIGSSVDTAEVVPFRTTDNYMDTGLPLVSDLKQQEFPKGFEKTLSIVILHNDPLPITVLSIGTRFYASPN